MQIIHYLSVFVALACCAANVPAYAQSRSPVIYGNQSSLHFRSSPNASGNEQYPASVQEQIKKCWYVPKDGRRLPPVIIHASFERDGSLIKAQLPDSANIRYSNDSLYRLAVSRAFSAIRRCTPLKHVPSNAYNMWQSVTIIFSP